MPWLAPSPQFSLGSLDADAPAQHGPAFGFDVPLSLPARNRHLNTAKLSSVLE